MTNDERTPNVECRVFHQAPVEPRPGTDRRSVGERSPMGRGYNGGRAAGFIMWAFGIDSSHGFRYWPTAGVRGVQSIKAEGGKRKVVVIAPFSTFGVPRDFRIPVATSKVER